ncbi:MAG: hypothetical protein QUS33_00225 [Dehalococcoidia bacterium]|nr:hypothetical protein [Dehalococcoidia bacterium]
MGETETFAPAVWSTLVARLFEHDLVRLLCEADVKTLGKPAAVLTLYDHLRSFMALKSSLKSVEPPEILRPANEALLNFTARLFMAAHQALLNEGQRDSPPARTDRWRSRWHHKPAVPTKEFLLEWQLVRLKAARHRLIMELADLAEKNEQLFRNLGLPEAVEAEVESARRHISSVWKGLPNVLREVSSSGDTSGPLATGTR